MPTMVVWCCKREEEAFIRQATRVNSRPQHNPEVLASTPNPHQPPRQLGTYCYKNIAKRLCTDQIVVG